MAEDVVTVGDLNSDARGSGARKSAGKPQWAQLPVWALDDIIVEYECTAGFYRDDEPTIRTVIASLASWQQGEDEALAAAALQTLFILAREQGVELFVGGPPLRALASTVAVLEFGAKKYKVGNWAKGMPWSVCFSCALSHAFYIANGEKNDTESGLSHAAHLMCNLLFLLAYRYHYLEGDDRIVEFRAPEPPMMAPYDARSGFSLDVTDDTQLWNFTVPITGDFS